MKSNKEINWQILITIVLAIALISITVFVINKEKEEIAKQEPEKVYVGYDNEETLENFSRDHAVAAMQDILKGIAKDVEGKDRTVEERMEALNDGETDLEDVINQETIDKLYLSEDFKENKFNRQFTASILLTYHQLIAEVEESNEFEPLIDVFEEVVYLDSKLMTAHIPLDVFIGENRGIAFEMQYIDGEWKFNPYTAMMSLVMVVNYEEQIQHILSNQDSEDDKSEKDK